MNFFYAVIAGIAAGVISAWGVGGGTLLIIFMSLFTNIPQQTAQGINLLYFIPVSGAALISHVKNKLIVMRAVIPAVAAGLPAAVVCALAASRIDSEVMRKIFAVFVIAVGVSELFKKTDKRGGKTST